jgi:hypothetical protein
VERRSWRRLAQRELHLAEIAAACLRRLEPADDPVAPVAWVVDDDHDRLHALGDATRGGATAARQLDELGAQRGVQAILEPCHEAAALVRREAEAIVVAERDVNAAADERSVAIGPSPCVALLEDHAVSLGLGMRGMKGANRGAPWQCAVKAWRRGGRGLSIGPEASDRLEERHSPASRR